MKSLMLCEIDAIYNKVPCTKILWIMEWRNNNDAFRNSFLFTLWCERGIIYAMSLSICIVVFTQNLLNKHLMFLMKHSEWVNLETSIWSFSDCPHSGCLSVLDETVLMDQNSFSINRVYPCKTVLWFLFHVARFIKWNDPVKSTCLNLQYLGHWTRMSIALHA